MSVKHGFFCALLLALTVLPAAAQDGQGDVVYVPTPQVVVDEMLSMAKIGAGDFLIDLGSGDGRIVITAAKKYGTRGIGVDLDTYLVQKAREGARIEGVADKAQFVVQNLFETDLSRATVISSYLLPELNEKLLPKLLALKPGTRIIAHDYDMGDWPPDEQKSISVPGKEVGDPGKSYVFFYVVPANIAGAWESLVYSGRHGVICEFDFDQRFQRVSGEVRIDGKRTRLPLFKMSGDQVSFEVGVPHRAGMTQYRFQGTVRQDTIEGTLMIGGAKKPLPWKARLKVRGEFRISALDAAGGVLR